MNRAFGLWGGGGVLVASCMRVADRIGIRGTLVMRTLQHKSSVCGPFALVFMGGDCECVGFDWPVQVAAGSRFWIRAEFVYALHGFSARCACGDI